VRYAVQAEHEQTFVGRTHTDQDSTADLKKKIVDPADSVKFLEPIFNTLASVNESQVIYTPKSAPVPSRPVEPAEPQEVRKITKQKLEHISTPSIKDALQGKFKDDQLSAKQLHEVFTREEEKELFTFEQLTQKWDAFIARLDDKPNLQSTLSRVPELKDNFQLEIEIDNSVQEDLINNIKPELLTYLRIELKNSLIQLNVVYAKNSKGRVIYTDSDKFEELLKKNPNLNLLRQKMGLDFGS
jgi:hypothetical protein